MVKQQRLHCPADCVSEHLSCSVLADQVTCSLAVEHMFCASACTDLITYKAPRETWNSDADNKITLQENS